MIGLLAKIFIADKDNLSKSEARSRYGALCGGVGIALNLFLFAIKIAAGFISDSVAIIADAVNNLGDAGSNIIMLVGFNMSSKEPDPEHPFGHGRIEYVTGLIVSLLIILMGVELVKSSVDKIINPRPVEVSMLVLAILIISVLVKLYMYIYNISMSKKLTSATFKAVAKDSLTDAASTFAVMLSMLVMNFTELNVDGLLGLIVSGFVLYTGITSAMDTISPLLGTKADPGYVRKIEEYVLSYDMIVGMHDLVIHDYGPGRVMLSLHAEVPADKNIIEVHDVIDIIERNLRDKLGCHAVIHMDPIVVGDPEVDMMKERCLAIAKSVDVSLAIHDFRMVKGPTHTNLIFDVLAPYAQMSEKEIKTAIADKVSQMEDGNYFAVIEVDRPFI